MSSIMDTLAPRRVFPKGARVISRLDLRALLLTPISREKAAGVRLPRASFTRRASGVTPPSSAEVFLFTFKGYRLFR